MKRSRIFLGVTTCLLAVAGVAAANRFGTNKTRLYCTLANSPGYCIATSQLFVFTQTTTGTSNIVTIAVTDPNTGTLTHRFVYTAGTVNNRCGGSNDCVHPLINVGN